MNAGSPQILTPKLSLLYRLDSPSLTHGYGMASLFRCWAQSGGDGPGPSFKGVHISVEESETKETSNEANKIISVVKNRGSST